jgi:hypothetical protein
LLITANPGDTTISIVDAVGWNIGDEIVVASTAYDGRQAETFTITSITNTTNGVLTYSVIGLNSQMQNYHDSIMETLSDG